MIANCLPNTLSELLRYPLRDVDCGESTRLSADDMHFFIVVHTPLKDILWNLSCFATPSVPRNNQHPRFFEFRNDLLSVLRNRKVFSCFN